jgi:hypothetical protein
MGRIQVMCRPEVLMDADIDSIFKNISEGYHNIKLKVNFFNDNSLILKGKL